MVMTKTVENKSSYLSSVAPSLVLICFPELSLPPGCFSRAAIEAESGVLREELDPCEPGFPRANKAVPETGDLVEGTGWACEGAGREGAIWGTLGPVGVVGFVGIPALLLLWVLLVMEGCEVEVLVVVGEAVTVLWGTCGMEVVGGFEERESTFGVFPMLNMTVASV